MQLFYTKKIDGQIANFDEEEAHHATQTLRLKIGSELSFTDGMGNIYRGAIMDIGKKTCAVNILEIKSETPASTKLHIALAPTKNIDRFEFFIEKCTEIGIHAITPLICKRSERQIIKPERLNKILISAMKQSLRSFLPQLNAAQSFEAFILQDFKKSVKLLAHCEENNEIISEKTLLNKAYQKEKNAVILIGPEGDFSPEEISSAHKNGFIDVSLGDARLRTETAGIFACSAFNIVRY